MQMWTLNLRKTLIARTNHGENIYCEFGCFCEPRCWKSVYIDIHQQKFSRAVDDKFFYILDSLSYIKWCGLGLQIEQFKIGTLTNCRHYHRSNIHTKKTTSTKCKANQQLISVSLIWVAFRTQNHSASEIRLFVNASVSINDTTISGQWAFDFALMRRLFCWCVKANAIVPAQCTNLCKSKHQIQLY